MPPPTCEGKLALPNYSVSGEVGVTLQGSIVGDIHESLLPPSLKNTQEVLCRQLVPVPHYCAMLKFHPPLGGFLMTYHNPGRKRL